MGKSDLIFEKLSALKKSQPATSPAPAGPRPASKVRVEEKPAAQDSAEKRITSRTGAVVVRRRASPRAEEDPTRDDGTGNIPGSAFEVSPPAFGSDSVVVQGTQAGSNQNEFAHEITHAETRTVEVSERNLEPLGLAAEKPESIAGPASAEHIRSERESGVRSSHAVQVDSGVTEDTAPVRPAVDSSPKHSAHSSGMNVPAISFEPSIRSIEEELSKQQGHVKMQARAVVVDRKTPLQASTQQHSDASMHARQDDRNGYAQRAPASGGQPGQPPKFAPTPSSTTQPPRKPTLQSPTSVKEIANEERKKEKSVVKGTFSRNVAKTGKVEEVGDRAGRGLKAKRTAKKTEIVQRQDVLVQESDSVVRRNKRHAPRREKAKTKLTTPKAIKRIIRIEDKISVGELAHRMGVKAPAVIKRLIPLGIMATINESIDHDTASIIAVEFNYEVENVAFNESSVLPEVTDTEESLLLRPPVVTIMGHVDHGKTTLLDAIRNTDVASREAGGITQHIGAYSVEVETGKVVFLDTPGHEAFTSMRARGASVTDIVILVVAADDGVMPQTVEALNHAKAANVPVIVAVNKIDKPGAAPDRVKQKLAEHGLVPEEWGGQTIYAEVSAKTGRGIRELLEMILLQAEVLELRANPNRAARATVIESQLDRGRGPVATILVSGGTLRVGEIVVVGSQYGKVRAMIDDHGRSVKEAGPSLPVEILGLSGLPEAGDALAVVDDLEKARTIAEHREKRSSTVDPSKTSRVTLEDLFNRMQAEEVKELRLILKTDFQGSMEALQKAITDIASTAVKATILHAGVGSISEGDISLASVSNAVVVGFNVKPDAIAAALAEKEGVQIRTYNVIYEALDELKLAMQGLLKPILKERVLGHAEVRETFSIPKIGLIGGSAVTDGEIQRGAMARMLRGGKVLWEGKLASLRRFKDDVRKVDKGYECGIALENFSDLKAGDIIESYLIEETRPSL